MISEKIKYRAWHKEKKIMFQISEIDLRKKRIKGRANNEVISSRFDEVDIMMGANIEDSNGEEVYEGDILMAVADDEMKSILGYLGRLEHVYFEVKYDDHQLYCYNRWKKCWLSLEDVFDCRTVKVLGNKYSYATFWDENYKLLRQIYIDDNENVVFVD